jgi:putative ABC transport system permease protein
MFIHQLKQIIRGLWRYKSFTIINFLGLSIGIAAIVILYLISDYEKGFDLLHSDSNRIYRLVSEKEREGKKRDEATIPYPTATYLRDEYSGVVATEIHFDRDRNIKVGEKAPFEEKNMVFADSVFFHVMDFSGIPGFWIKGNPAKALDAPNKAVLTQSTALRYFGNEDPIGKTFRLDNERDIEVVGLVKDVPAATHLPINLFVSYSTLDSSLMGGLSMDNWNFTSNGYCYVKVNRAEDTRSIESAMKSIVQKKARDDRDKKQVFSLQPLADIHFNPLYENSNPNYTVSHQYLKMLLLLGVFIILIACINYINLSTSLAFSKSKEVGIRKTIGASAPQLFLHYMTETVFVTGVAALIGIGMAILALPTINHILDKSIVAASLFQSQFILTALLGILMISILSGAYPALILSRFNPIFSLKNQLLTPGKSSGLLRKALVVFQFSTSIALIICTIVIAKQVNYFTSKSVGFNKEAVVEVPIPKRDSAARESFRAQLQNQTGISNLSFCLGAPISDNGINTSFEAPELAAGTEYSIHVIPCDGEYLKTYGIKMLAGRWFLPGEEKHLGSAVVINETTMKTLGYKQPAEVLGKKISIGINEMKPAVVGVVQDFHTTSLHKAISNTAMIPFPYFYFAAGIRLDPKNIRGELATVETAWKKVFPDDPYQFSFIDQTLAKRYEQETRDYNLFKAFSAISIFICCIGLWGLIAFVVVRKTKEIGIRKVLGATVSNIVGLLSVDFLKLVLLALIVASPIAWYFMSKWLENFVYRINISWWVFALAGLLAVAIALFTISFQTVRAALSNPVKNLRTE